MRRSIRPRSSCSCVLRWVGAESGSCSVALSDSDTSAALSRLATVSNCSGNFPKSTLVDVGLVGLLSIFMASLGSVWYIVILWYTPHWSYSICILEMITRSILCRKVLFLTRRFAYFMITIMIHSFTHYMISEKVFHLILKVYFPWVQYNTRDGRDRNGI